MLFGHGHHLFRGAGLAAADGMDSPVEIEAVHYRDYVGEGVDGNFGAVFGDHAGGVAGFGEDGDGAHGEIVGGVGDGFADGFGNGESAVLAAAAGLAEFGEIIFCFDDDAGHDGDSFVGIASAGSFGGEHYGVGAVEDGVGHVAGFGARGARVFDHGFEHLRGGDDRAAPRCCAADYVLLNYRDFFRSDFYA